MKAAKISKSARLQNVWWVLQDGGWWSTMDIIQLANVCAVNSCISELRANGKQIICQRRGDVWYYRRAKRGERA